MKGVFTRRIKDERSLRACTAPDLKLSHTPILSACRMPGPPVTLFFIICGGIPQQPLAGRLNVLNPDIGSQFAEMH